MERFGITVDGQLRELLLFAGVGVLIGLWYELFRLWRLFVSPGAGRIFWQDLLAFAGAAVITQLAALPISSGRVRVIHLTALALGFATYYATIGRLIHVSMRWAVGWIRRFSDWCGRGVRRLGVAGSGFLVRFWTFFRKKSKKIGIFFKKRLQHTKEV